MTLTLEDESVVSHKSKYTLPVGSSITAAAAAKSLQSCPTLWGPRDGSPPGSPVPGILQARTLEWVAISFSNTWKWKVKVKPLSRVRLLVTPWTTAHQAPPSMGFPRQEHWSGVPLPSLHSLVFTQRLWKFKSTQNSAPDFTETSFKSFKFGNNKDVL